MHKLFLIPGLLHMILAYLPLNEILIDQRVCHEWRDGVQSDPTLQRLLYFRPAGAGLVSWKAAREPDNLRGYLHEEGRWQYDSGQSTLPLLSPFLHRYITIWRPGGFLSIFHPGFIGPPQHIPYRPRIPSWFYEEHSPEEIEELRTLGPRDAQEWKAMCHKGASWRGMFMMQPPCRVLQFVCLDSRAPVTLVDPRGLRLGQVVDFLRAHSKLCPDCTSSYDVPRWDFRGNQLWQISSFSGIPDGSAMGDMISGI